MESQYVISGDGILAQLRRLDEERLNQTTGVPRRNTNYTVRVEESPTIQNEFTVADIENALRDLIAEHPEIMEIRPWPFGFHRTINKLKMNITDLMIGDYIKYFSEPVKVKQIRTNNGEIKVITSNDDDGIIHECSTYDISYLPLTKDILDMNFSHTSQWWFQGSADIYLRIYEEKGKFWLIVKYKGTNIRKKISYVHELQHCLKLCNYDKIVIV